MKFLADMNMSLRTVIWLRQQGYKAIYLEEEGLQRLPDEDVLAKACHEKRVLLTMDKTDFGRLLATSEDCEPSIILFRLSEQRVEFVNKRLADVLATYKEDLQAGAMISVGDETIRIRRLPIRRR